jgi:hypothetical protein
MSRPVPETDELRATLGPLLSRHFGVPRTVLGLERRPSPYQSSYALEELEVRLDDGTTLRLLFKALGPQALLPGGRRVKPAFLSDPRREVEVYRTVLASGQMGTATCYGAVLDPAAGRYWLFLENVPGAELYRVGDLALWQQAARWLARFHSRFAGEAERLEFYASNVLVQAAEEPRVCPVDWEMAAVGPALADVAALTAGNWTPEARESVALAYLDALPAGAGPARAAFLEALDYCRLQQAVQWLGWSADWTPPREHAQDWLGEALRLAGQLGL